MHHSQELIKHSSYHTDMYLVYLDESGSPPPTDPDPYYTLGGLVISERTWKTLNDEIDKIKNNYGLGEIHTRRIYRSHKKSPHTQYASCRPGRQYPLYHLVRLLCSNIPQYLYALKTSNPLRPNVPAKM